MYSRYIGRNEHVVYLFKLLFLPVCEYSLNKSAAFRLKPACTEMKTNVISILT